jgi:hypothetical protein
VIITDTGSLSVTETVDVTVEATPTSIVLAPEGVEIPPNESQQFTAAVCDQFGDLISPPPSLSWSAVSGQITATGLYTASRFLGSDTITASIGGVQDDVRVTIIEPSTKLLGDADYNRTVDQGDAAILCENWGMASGAAWSDGDFNGDGQVNLIDAAIFAANFGATMPEAAEPPATEAPFIGPIALEPENAVRRPLLVARRRETIGEAAAAGLPVVDDENADGEETLDGLAAAVLGGEGQTVHDAALATQIGPWPDDSGMHERQNSLWARRLLQRRRT